jgi:uncharacterized damage-inducible protein DinB
MLKLNTRLFERCLDGLDDATAVRRPSGLTNNMALVAAHLVDARYFIARHLGASLGPLFGGALDEVTSIEQVEEFPAVEEIRGAWELASNALAALIPTLGPEELGGEPPVQSPSSDSTLGGWIQFMMLHEMYHIGQLAFLRRLFGLAAMRWS